MSMRDGIFTTVAVALSGGALAGLLATDVYSQAASAEARGVKALTMQVEMRCEACPERPGERWAVAHEEVQGAQP